MGELHHSEALAEIRSGRIRPVYLIYGGEPFLEEELFRALRTAVVQPETADFNFHLVDPEPDQVGRAVSTARTQPFFAERRLVVLRDSPLFVASRKAAEEEQTEEAEESSGTGEESLLAYLKAPAPSTCFVILSKQTVDSRKRVTKAAIAAGGAVECRPLKEQDCVMWAQARAQSYGKRLSDGAARGLIEKTGTDLRTIDSELQKLGLYVGQAPEITAADVEAAVGGVAETEIFRLTEAVMLKERARAISLMERMLLQVDHPLQILAALTTRFRQMLMVKALTARGLSVREGAAAAKMHPFPYEKMAGHLRSYLRAEVVAGMRKLLQADLAIKTGADARLTLEALVADLLGPPEPAARRGAGSRHA